MVGVVGRGFVGGALCEVLGADSWDIDPARCTVSSLSELCDKHEIIFVCVPTPSRADGSCDTSMVEDVVSRIRGNTVVVKSTVTPGTCERLGVVYNPEFLRQSDAVNEFRATTRVVLGGDDGTVADYYRGVFEGVEITHLTRTQAELVKYAANCLLATKVAFCNELWQVCMALGVDYGPVAGALSEDRRLGPTHWDVPGPDGQMGFGGACFPKDIQALIHLADTLQVDALVNKAAWRKSCEVR